MGFPIVTGGRSSSSRRLPQQDKVEAVCHCLAHCGPSMVAMSTNSTSSLTATMTIKYSTSSSPMLVEEDDIIKSAHTITSNEYSVAQIEIRIADILSPSTTSASTSVSKYHIPIPTQQQETSNTGSMPNNMISPQIIFSLHDQYMACLIPHCFCKNNSSVVIFDLEPDSASSSTALPYYLLSHPNGRKAVQPRMVHHLEEQRITSICAAGKEDSFFFLAGCNTNGSIIAIPWKRRATTKLSTRVLFPGHDHLDTQPHGIISKMSSSFQDEQDFSQLAVLNSNGSVLLFTIALSKPMDTSPNVLKRMDSSIVNALKVEYIYTIDIMLPCIDILWIESCILAVAIDTVASAERQDQQQTFTACQVWEVASSTPPNLVSTLTFNINSNNDSSTNSQPNENNNHIGAFDERISTLNSNNNNDNHSKGFQMCSHHRGNNVIVISSCYAKNRQSFLCIWDWKSCTIGFQLSFSKRLVFSHIVIGYFGYTLSHHHIIENSIVSLVHDTYELSILNPSRQQHASSLLLSAHYVGFPLLSHATLSCQANVSPDVTIDFRETMIPSTYTTVYGPPHVACMGRKFCRSIAVASSRGLCILDLSQLHNFSISDPVHRGTTRNKTNLPCVGTTIIMSKQQKRENFTCGNKISKKLRQIKWRMMREQEERQFQVHAMIWWEINGVLKQQHGSRRNTEENFVTSEDLLFAVIEMMDKNITTHPSNNGKRQLRLVCWSRRRLGLNIEDQMLKDVNSVDSSLLGISLPSTLNNISTMSMSILPSPCSLSSSSNRHDKENHTHRALLLISSEASSYVVAELQLCRSDESQDDTNGDFSSRFRNTCVLGRLSGGEISIPRSVNVESGIPSKITEVFLAGGSFQFDLQNLKGARSQLKAGYCHKRDPASFFAVLGVVTVRNGIFAISLSADLRLSAASLIVSSQNDCIKTGRKQPSGLAYYWQSDIMEEPSSFFPNNGRLSWTICCRDGEMMLWSVPLQTTNQASAIHNTIISVSSPFVINASPPLYLSQNPGLISTISESNKSFHFPMSVRTTLSEHQNDIHFHEGNLGEIYLLDSAISSGSWSPPGDKYFIGPLPSLSTFVLAVGQRSRRFGSHGQTLSAHQLNHRDNNDNMCNTVLSITSFVLGHPSHTASLLSLISQIVAQKHLSNQYHCQVNPEVVILWGLVLERTKLQGFDHSLDVALRLIIVFAVDMIISLDGISSTAALHRDLFLSLLHETISVARELFDRLHFSFFFLCIARQLEPRHFNVLFPLKFSDDAATSEAPQLAIDVGSLCKKELSKCVEDLFMDSIALGSVAFATAGLPLFKSHDLSHRACIKMLRHCLEVVSEDCESSVVEYRHLEERSILRELFQYGLKVEESLTLCHQSDGPVAVEHESSPMLACERTDTKGNNTTPTNAGIIRRITSRLAHFFIYSGFWDENNALLRETEISGVTVEDHSDQNKAYVASLRSLPADEPFSTVAIKTPVETVKRTVALFFVSTLFSKENSPPTKPWKKLGFLSQILSVGSSIEFNSPFCKQVSKALLNNTAIANMICVTNEEFHQMTLKTTDSHSILFNFLLSHLMECSRQIGKASCAALFSLAMILLQDSANMLTDSPLNTELAVIVVISGYLGGFGDFIRAVVDGKRAIFMETFQMAQNAFPNIV